jgi:hypothetical protein
MPTVKIVSKSHCEPQPIRKDMGIYASVLDNVKGRVKVLTSVQMGSLIKEERDLLFIFTVNNYVISVFYQIERLIMVLPVRVTK